MAKRWLGGALIIGCLLAVPPVRAQYLPMGPGPCQMPEPLPLGPCATPCAPRAVEGPISPQAAPKGPNSCCDLPCDLPGAFDECPDRSKGCGGLWFTAEYLHWWFKDTRLPPLFTIGDPNDFNPGAIGQPGTIVAFPPLGQLAGIPIAGGLPAGTDVTGNIDDGGDHSGGRYTFGLWFNRSETFGCECSYFRVGSLEFNLTNGPPSVLSPIITRPVFNIAVPQEDAFIVTAPQFGVLGTFNVNVNSFIWGGEANCICTAFISDCWRLDFLAGGRYLQLAESIDITQNVTDVNGTFGNLPGSSFLTDDLFKTSNRFLGGQIGFRTEARCGRFFANFQGKLAAGVNREKVQILGLTQGTNVGSLPQLDMGGILALPTNIGKFSRSQFALAPSLDVNVGYYICGWCRFFVGYSLLNISEVLRPGDQIDRVINETQTNHLAGGPFVGLPRPAVLFRTSDFLAQGVNIGLEFRY